MTANQTESPDEILRETERTRADIDKNLEALERRLSPDEMLNQVERAVGPARDGAVVFARNLGDTLRDNPIPAAMVGIGLAWLLVSGRRSDTAEYDPAYRVDPSRSAHDPAPGYYAEDDTPSRVRAAQDYARERGGEVRDRVRGTADTAYRRASETANGVYRRASDTGYRAGQRISDGAAAAGNFVQRRPVLTGAVIAGVGAVIAAAMFARTDRGRALSAQAADAVRDGSRRVGETARETAERVAEAASHAASGAKQQTDRGVAQAKESAERAGENLGQRAEAAREKAREAVDRAAEAGSKAQDGGPSASPDTRSVSEQVRSGSEPHEPLKPAAVKPVPVSPPPFEGPDSPAGAGEVQHHDADQTAAAPKPGAQPGSTTDSKGAPPGSSRP